ncbi:MAG: DUF3857 and transglutaminase domain-containing protein [Acidobacteria bacterium]|nr:DUF3857 and transglutaminase domain-containing protein [Acidobacteriota bacterium]
MTFPLRTPARSFFLAISLLFAVSLSQAADWPPITPEEQSLNSVPNQPGAAAIILFHQETDDDLMHYHSVTMRIKILTDAGRKYGDVQLPYNRKHFKISEIAGRTVHSDGTVIPFEGKPFDKVILKGHGIRVHVKSFTLPDVQAGSIIDYRYSLRYDDNTVYAPEWIVQSDLYDRRASYKFVPYNKDNLILAHGRIGNGVSWTSYLPKGFSPKQESNQVSTWVSLNLNDVPAFTEEPFMPPVDTMKLRVNFYYRINGKMEDFWKDEGKYWNKEVEGFVNRKKGVAEAVTQATAATDTPEQKLKKLYTLVQSFENQSYIPYRAEQEEHNLGLKPNEGAEDVLSQKSGTHDELNRLYASLARAAGFQAWMMHVPDRSDQFFDKNFLSTDQFDGEIVIVEVNGKDMFLDPGTKFCPFGVLNWRYSTDEGLRQSANGVVFAQSPSSEYNQGMTTRLARVQLTQEGRVEGNIGVAFYGLEGMNLRLQADKTDEAGKKKLLEDRLRDWLPGNSDVTLMNAPKWTDTETPLIAEFKISSPLATSAGKRWIIAPHIFQTGQRALFPSSTRTNPVYFDYPSREIDEVHITLPPGAEVESLPANDSLKTEFSIYQTTQKAEAANAIFSRRELIIGGVGFPTSMYKDIKDFYDKVKTGDDQQVILKAASHAAGN